MKDGAVGHCRVHLVESKKGNKGRRKGKKKKGETRIPLRPKKKLKQSNLDGIVIESLDVEGFGDHSQLDHPSDVTRVAF